MSRPLKVLIVEDNEDDLELVLLELKRGGASLTSIQYSPSRVTASANCLKSTGLRT